jgi:UDP-N-acetylglucosamine 2-epimerase
MYDSILYHSKIAEKKSRILHDLNLVDPEYYLATLHRAENTDDPKKLRSILRAFNEIGKETRVVLPLHPRTEKVMKAHRLFSKSKNIKFVGPVPYLDMLQLEKNAKAVLTDSGGVQKEAYWFGVPCFTLRQETEWVETVRSGRNVLVGTKAKKIVKGVEHFHGRGQSGRALIFGDGRASEKIVQLLVKHFG